MYTSAGTSTPISRSLRKIFVTCGTDYHHDGQPITAGMFVPDDINDEKSLVRYIENNDFERIEDVIGYEKGCKAYRESLCK